MLRKEIFVVTILFGTLWAYGFGQSAAPGLQQELIAADRGIWEAIAGPHPDIGKVSAALAPDYIDIDSGVRHPREEVLDYLRGLTNFSFQYEHVRGYVLSPTSGYVIAELRYSSVQKGTAAAGKVLTTTVFSKERGRWLAHLHTEMDIKAETR